MFERKRGGTSPERGTTLYTAFEARRRRVSDEWKSRSYPKLTLQGLILFVFLSTLAAVWAIANLCNQPVAALSALSLMVNDRDAADLPRPIDQTRNGLPGPPCHETLEYRNMRILPPEGKVRSPFRIIICSSIWISGLVF